VKDLQRFAVTMDLSSETLNATHRVPNMSSPVSYFASLTNHDIHETSSVAACSMPYFSGTSLTIDDTQSLYNGKITFLHETITKKVLQQTVQTMENRKLLVVLVNCGHSN
jgi:hypothetical protein